MNIDEKAQHSQRQTPTEGCKCIFSIKFDLTTFRIVNAYYTGETVQSEGDRRRKGLRFVGDVPVLLYFGTSLLLSFPGAGKKVKG